MPCLNQKIIQDWHRGGLGLPGGAVWEGAIILSDLISKDRDELKISTSNILELGSGLGLVSIVCAKIGAPKVIIHINNTQKILNNIQIF